ncbi:hypothetical protein LCGC14_1473430 [marine sediment metagenome]|uniref:Sulfotransferase domain-containing protein n=1 Tax=marine sediment metagenome TaxID=412755 RepID=A0A0F9JXM5_9ZZZZ
MISQIKYVVVSTPRSATGWTSQVLCAMGLKCGHERHFTHDKQSYESKLESDYMWGDSSWMAAPFIGDLPRGTMVLHQVREPCATIASLVGLRHFDHWDRALDEYHIFMRAHLPHELPDGLNAIQRAAHFWLTWNEMIEATLASRPDLEWIRYRIETPTIVELLCGWLTDHEPSRKLLAKGMAVPTDFNRRRGLTKPDVTMDLLPTRVADLARRYGYG